MTMSKVIGQTFLLYYITNYWYTCRMYRLGGGGRQVPDWLTKEQTALIQKDKAKGNIASNYRPITCLTLVWKLLTGILTDEIYDYLEEMLLPEKQKGCKQKCKRAGDLVFIDKMILYERRK